MHQNGRFVAVNGQELRRQRLARGLTQVQLAKLAGYTERLVRKAEKGCQVDRTTIQNLAEALSTPETPVSVASLTVDLLAIARRWVEAFESLEVKMLPAVVNDLHPDFEFICPGNPEIAPFIGTWKGAAGLQQFLDNLFGILKRDKAQNIEYFLGDTTVIARWMAKGKLHGVPYDLLRVILHFQFQEGLILRITDEYDTQAGADILTQAKTRKIEDEDSQSR